MDNQNINWGIAGTGKIAGRFASDLKLVPDANLRAVSSRSKSTAEAFAAQYDVEQSYDSLDQMLKEGQIDILYVASPHPVHLEQTLASLSHKVAVLCEKPASLNRQEVAQMVDASQKHQTFFMEALWTRFIPAMVRVKNIIDSGEMGEVEQVEAEFCFTAPVNFESRLYNMDLGGGSILDIGIYPVFLAYTLLGMPTKISASGQLAETGADQTCSMNLEYAGGKGAALHCSIITDSMMPARITMNKGYLLMHPRWHEAPALTILKAGEEPLTIDCQPAGLGFTHEIVACHQCLRQDLIECPEWSHQDSLNVAEILDEVRRQVGVNYPGRD